MRRMLVERPLIDEYVGIGSPRVSVVIPTLNEADNLPFALSTLNGRSYEVIVVDGRSHDDTIRVATALRPDVRIVREMRPGKGAALKAGFEAATGDVIVMLDADGSADGREIPAFVDALVAGADFAKGSRYLLGGGTADITMIRHTGNGALTQLVNRMFGASFTDLCYGYNAFWRSCLPYLDLDCDGFEVETLLTLRALRSGLRITEVASYESARIHGNTNLRAARDGMRVLRTILQEAERSPMTVSHLASATSQVEASAHDVEAAFRRLTADVAPTSVAPRVCVVGPGRHAPVLGVVTDHMVHSLLSESAVSSIQLAVPDDPWDWTLIGLNTPSLAQVPTVPSSASPNPMLRRRRARRFMLRHQPAVVMLEWWSDGQLMHFRDIAHAAHDGGAKVVLRCCGVLQTETRRTRSHLKQLLPLVDLVVSQGYVPKALTGAPLPVVDIIDLRTEERQFDPSRLSVLVFLPNQGIEVAKVVLAAFEGLSESRSVAYRLELATTNEAEADVLRATIAGHHHADRISVLAHRLSDVELQRRLDRDDVAILIDPQPDSRALESVQHSGLPTVVVATDDANTVNAYPGAAACPLDAASVLAAIERANLARRYRYPSASRWAAGIARLRRELTELVAP